ncbi:hypothetical protein HK096_001658 [Nowakowskiella sp. JEL0078]|nr:hypothetical protein HK096_001658 [Nowakowskiella sp. JEL0078]
MSTQITAKIKKAELLFHSLFWDPNYSNYPVTLPENLQLLAQHVSINPTESVVHARFPSTFVDSTNQIVSSYLTNRETTVQIHIKTWFQKHLMMEYHANSIPISADEWYRELGEILLIKQLSALLQLRARLEVLEQDINPWKIRPHAAYPFEVRRVLWKRLEKGGDISTAEMSRLAKETGLREQQVYKWFVVYSF